MSPSPLTATNSAMSSASRVAITKFSVEVAEVTPPLLTIFELKEKPLSALYAQPIPLSVLAP